MEKVKDKNHVKAQFYVPFDFADKNNSATLTFLEHICYSRQWSSSLWDYVKQITNCYEVNYAQQVHALCNLLEWQVLRISEESQLEKISYDLYQELLLDAVYSVDLFSIAELLLKEYYELTVISMN